ncbi:GNAT family N-acetyltransferase [Campylobacter lari]|nr:GNAT family N-acetyltransferase [Campylobacter lari]EAK9878454.1 GNAT family N-acetyltransferase [Campylobacter lari]EAK9953249.1 GNAT family N-acetyltransferase [Campylobacter lari]EAK9953645.1 GNAT family N-acetyltransferase [Campylobacter lari]EAL3894456.1 GNAT family N-acetyltransferase [Campylobacter lari]
MIRKLDIKDLASCIKLFKQSVSTLCKNDYTKEQIHAWTNISQKAWEEKFQNQLGFAYEEKGQIISFISINLKEKILDLCFTHANYAHQGYGKALLEFALKNYPYSEIYTFASLSAKNFFLKAGFKIIKENIAIIDQQELKNFLMKKEIN